MEWRQITIHWRGGGQTSPRKTGLGGFAPTNSAGCLPPDIHALGAHGKVWGVQLLERPLQPTRGAEPGVLRLAEAHPGSSRNFTAFPSYNVSWGGQRRGRTSYCLPSVSFFI